MLKLIDIIKSSSKNNSNNSDNLYIKLRPHDFEIHNLSHEDSNKNDLSIYKLIKVKPTKLPFKKHKINNEHDNLSPIQYHDINQNNDVNKCCSNQLQIPSSNNLPDHLNRYIYGLLKYYVFN